MMTTKNKNKNKKKEREKKIETCPDDESDNDEEEDDGHGLGDMIVEETQEKKAEARKRAELHRKWLEQQDSVTTDDILLRLKSGWKSTENRKRGLEFLADDDDIHHIPLKQSKRAQEHVGSDNEDEMPDEKEDSRDSAVLNGEDLLMEEEAKRFNTFEDVDDAQSDDSVAKQMMVDIPVLPDLHVFPWTKKEREHLQGTEDEESYAYVLMGCVYECAVASKLHPECPA